MSYGGFNKSGFNKTPFNRSVLVRTVLFVGKTIRRISSTYLYSGLTRRIVQRIAIFFGIKDKNFSRIKDTNFSRMIKGSH